MIIAAWVSRGVPKLATPCDPSVTWTRPSGSAESAILAQARGRALNQPKKIPLDLEQQLGLDLPERCGTGTEPSTPHLEPAVLLVARILDGDHPPTIRQQTGVDSHGRGRAKVAKEGERPCPASGVPSPGMHRRGMPPRGPASSQVFPIAPLEQVISE